MFFYIRRECIASCTHLVGFAVAAAAVVAAVVVVAVAVAAVAVAAALVLQRSPAHLSCTLRW